MPKHRLIAYTDGACSGNPGPGGWGVLLQALSDDKVVKELEELVNKNKVDWKWVKGHAGNIGNERVDELARRAMEPYKKNNLS